MIYRFEQFEVDDREFRFSEHGTPLQVEPKVLRLLLYLIENRSRLVRKQELLDTVWQDAMVTENALTRAIGLLRKSLNDDSRVPKFIETVPTAGYRFIAKVTTAEDPTTPESATPQQSTPAATNPKTGFKPSTKWILASALLLAIAAAGVFLFSHHRKKILTEKDTVILADFDNSTGDPVFDGTLRQGMAVQLEQSPFLSLISDERIQRTLRLMGQPADARLTPALAREICERIASAAVLDGSIASLGTQYVLGLRATDCRTGKVLAEEQVQATRKEDVLNALGQAAGTFRTRLGESLTTVEKYDTPLDEAATPSLEALKAFSLGSKAIYAGGVTTALPFFKRAVELDPNFAEAYFSMAIIYGSHHEPELAAENIRKAYELRERQSERNRLTIEASYYENGTGELEKSVQALELLQQTYPRDFGPHIGLSADYRRLGNTEKALEHSREAHRLAPNNGLAYIYQNLGADYVNFNRLDEADAVYKEAVDRKLGIEGLAKSRYLLAFLKGDQAQMAQLASSVKGKRGDEDVMLGAQADTEAWYGRLKNSRELTRRATDSALHNDAKETAAGYQAALALFEVDSGNPEQGRADADTAMKLAPDRDVRRITALVLARAGDTAAAAKLAAELDKAFPLDTVVQRNWLPVIRAAISLQRKDPNRAIELLKTSSEIELGDSRLLPAYLRGEAYLMLHDGKSAAVEFQKYIDHRGPVRNSPWGALGRLNLARAYALQGDTIKARTAYQDFLTIWKDADPDLPILKQAKEEYAKLQ
jgi:eukaryotic-like serine/threonine-protein kinase